MGSSTNTNANTRASASTMPHAWGLANPATPKRLARAGKLIRQKAPWFLTQCKKQHRALIKAADTSVLARFFACFPDMAAHVDRPAEAHVAIHEPSPACKPPLAFDATIHEPSPAGLFQEIADLVIRFERGMDLSPDRLFFCDCNHQYLWLKHRSASE